MTTIKHKIERAILVGVGLKSENFQDIKYSLAELSELAIAAGADIQGSVVQVLTQWNPALLIGSGKVQEIRELALQTKANIIIFDHQLSGVQSRNLENEIGAAIIDRNQLIIDIFAQRAATHEGKLQVELAYLTDLNSRMVGAWMGSLSRQGGGIGTRGPGEKALEVDRRTIQKRITKIKKELESVKKHRAQHRKLRQENKVPSFALIGYTNAGKSTLLNTLTGSQALVKQQVFATLDPMTRKVYLPGASMAVVTDTVGFISKLPTRLIESFKATLEETAQADILIHLVDLSHPLYDKQIQTVIDIIKDLGWTHKPIIHVFNKMDETPVERKFKVSLSPRVFISALKGTGIDQLKTLMLEEIQNLVQLTELYFGVDEKHLIFDLSRDAQIQSQEETQNGITCQAFMTANALVKWSNYLVKSKRAK